MGLLWTLSAIGSPPGQPKWIPGHRLGVAQVTYVLLARKGFRLSASKRAWIQRLNGSAPLYRADAIKFGWDDATGGIMLESIRDAAERGGTPWLVFGDDDTHFDIDSIEAFAQSTPPTDNVVYGNIYDNRIFYPATRKNINEGCYRANIHSAATFPLIGGWFTGGSGVLIPATVARRITRERIKGCVRAKLKISILSPSRVYFSSNREGARVLPRGCIFTSLAVGPELAVTANASTSLLVAP